MVPPAAWDAAAQIGHRERTVARNLVERKVQAHKAREALARSAPDLALKPRPTGWTKTAKQVELEEAAIAAAARERAKSRLSPMTASGAAAATSAHRSHLGGGGGGGGSSSESRSRGIEEVENAPPPLLTAGALSVVAGQSKADDALYEANSTQRAAPWAASHVLVSRALGPVAGRAIAAERRQLLRQVDEADARARAVQHELLEAHGRLPESRACPPTDLSGPRTPLGNRPLAALSPPSSRLPVLALRAERRAPNLSCLNAHPCMCVRVLASACPLRPRSRRRSSPHDVCPSAGARETAAKEREVQARHERDAAYAAAELARLETERVRLVAPPVIARADRAEAQLEEFRQQAWSDVAALREQLEVTTADWRCAEAEAQQHAMDLAVARADLRHSEERCAVAEARAAEEASRAQEKLAAAAEERKVLDAHNNQLEREKAALEGELRALERRFDAEQEPVREERKTLREAVDAAEARASLVASQMAVVEQDRHAMRQEVAALRLELDARSEQHELRVSRLASEAQGAAGLAQTLGERLREAEAQRDRLAAELEQCRRGQEDEDDTMAKAQQMLLAERRRADAAEEARREAERSRYLGLHRPPADTTPSASVSGGGSSGVAPGERADATPDASSAAPPSALAAPTPARSYAPPPSLKYSTYRSSSTAGSAEAPWWWGTGGERAPSTERTHDSRPVPADAEQPQAIS